MGHRLHIKCQHISGLREEVCPICKRPGPYTDCSCGSGMHPRRCEKHPRRFDEHVAEINEDSYLDELLYPDDRPTVDLDHAKEHSHIVYLTSALMTAPHKAEALLKLASMEKASARYQDAYERLRGVAGDPKALKAMCEKIRQEIR